MDGIASVGSVGAVVSQAQFQVERQVRVLKEQQRVVEDLGTQALKLIQSAVVDTSAARHDLDISA